MSELREAAQAVVDAKDNPLNSIEDIEQVVERLRAALAQHVTEVVAGEREELLDLVDSYAKDNAPHEGPGGFSPGPLDAVVGRQTEE